MRRTSPSRYSPVTTGSAPPYAAASARAISPTVCGSPLPVLYAVSTPPAELASSAVLLKELTGQRYSAASAGPRIASAMCSTASARIIPRWT